MESHITKPPSRRDIRKLARENAAQGKSLDPMSDVVFKALFTGRDEDSRIALKQLLSAVIRHPVKDLHIKNNELLPLFFTGKTIRLDILVTFNNGEQADLEMQVSKNKDNLKARSSFLAAKLLSGQLIRGEKYQGIKRIYQIFFLDCKLFPGSDKVPRRYSMREETEFDKLNELTEIIFYEMPKLERIVRRYLEGKED
jgi:predicted transposase/invertase (TIGR01784 family)